MVAIINVEIRNRIKLAIAAFSYEYRDDPIISDAEFDELSRSINPEVTTGNSKLDSFFKNSFHPDTGMWIHQHPELRKLEVLYNKYYKGN